MADPDTPSLAFTYTRLGRRNVVTQSGVATWTFNYDDGETGETNTLRLVSETIAGTGGFYSKTITRDYDAIGRDAGFHIGSEYDVNYYPATDGRFERITGPGLWAYGVEYARLANSDLIEHVRYKIDYSSVRADVLRAYEPNRDLVDYVQNRVGSNNLLLATYDYTNDELGRRTRVDHSGPAFMTYSYYAAHTYNARSELTGTQRHLAAPPYPLLSPGVYGYTYDHIGNRQTSGVDGSGRTYTANDLNQYDSITNPAEIPDYDDDGNMLEDATFNYTWDAENRLVEAMTRIEAGASSTAYDTGDKHVYFTYDYMGRRVRKRVETYNGSSWPETSDELFVYDGWNVVMVLNANASNAITRKYTWGLDLSGTLHGAGGIGGLLACEEPQAVGDPKRYWFLYDANGNVGQVLDATDTGNITIAAAYEYDPYGNLINSSGPYADANPFRFSTKWFDEETGLGYWGYRYYSPPLGRWVSRDPIGERGGLNLCAFVKNSPSQAIDRLGKVGQWEPRYPPPRAWEPGPSCRGYCGLDITKDLEKLAEAVRRDFWDPSVDRVEVCHGIIGWKGWDIMELMRDDHTLFESSQCGKTPCRGTVTVGGTCQDPDQVNYFLWGLANRLCHDAGVVADDSTTWVGLFERDIYTYTEEEAVWLVAFYRRFWLWEELPSLFCEMRGRVMWTRAGYTGSIPSSASLEYMSRCSGVCRRKCQGCKETYGKGFSYHLGPNNAPGTGYIGGAY